MKAVFAIENHIHQCNPKTREDLELATYDITNAAIAALISVIGAKTTQEFLKSQLKVIKEEYFKSSDNFYENLEGLH
tara:strand:- start:2211 stop:2441 length:231 start_codon:yes stop_codon:yes gene_type:complete